MSLLEQKIYTELIDDLRNPRILTTVAHVEKKLGIKDRTFRRRLKELRDYGYIITSKVGFDDNGKKLSYYEIEESSNIELPKLPIILSENSYLAFVFMHRILKEFTNTPFEREVVDIMGKVEKYALSKSEEIAFATTLIANNITTMKPVLPKINRSIWPLLLEAVENVFRVSFRYMKMNGEMKDYTVNPYHIFLSDINFQNSWYLAGFVEDKREFRVFNLSRIRDVKVLTENFHMSKFKNPYPFIKISDILWSNKDSKLFDFVIEIDHTVIMSFQSTNWNLKEEYSKLDNGNYDMRFKTRLTPNIRSWIMSWGKYLKVKEPEILRDQIKEHILEMLKNLD